MDDALLAAFQLERQPASPGVPRAIPAFCMTL